MVVKQRQATARLGANAVTSVSSVLVQFLLAVLRSLGDLLSANVQRG